MQQQPQQQRQSAEELKSILLRRKITRPRFRWPLNKEQAVSLLTAAYAAEVEYRYRTFTLDDYTRRNIDTVAGNLISPSRFGLMFCGLCGNGKTTMLYAIQNATNYLNERRAFQLIGLDYKEVGIQIIEAREIALHRTNNYPEFAKIRQRPMLAIDDMGAEAAEVMNYGNILSPIAELLEYRYDRQLFTLLSSNVRPKDIKEHYGQRIADRFNEMMGIVVFENPTYRR